jgi:hypothetical protein
MATVRGHPLQGAGGHVKGKFQGQDRAVATGAQIDQFCADFTRLCHPSTAAQNEHLFVRSSRVPSVVFAGA